jgi:thiazole synthase
MKAEITGVQNPTFSCAGLNMTRIWHCFGNYMHTVDLNTVLRMLDASKTNVLPINTHRLKSLGQRDGLVIGFGDVTYDRLAAARDVRGLVKMVNINHQTSAAAAVAKTMLAVEMTGETVIKLEVLNPDMKTSNDDALIEATAELKRRNERLTVMPLLSNDLRTAKRLVGLGCPLLRVMGGGIGSGSGIADPATFGAICKLGVPVVLDGGVGRPSDLDQAIELGAEGALVNSMLFEDERAPDEVLGWFLSKVQPALTGVVAA